MRRFHPNLFILTKYNELNYLDQGLSFVLQTETARGHPVRGMN